MDRIPCAPYDKNADWILRPPCAPNDKNAHWILRPQHHGEGIEELKHLLLCVSLELEQARANSEAQKQLEEARLLQLQELLTTTRRERDEAQEQLLQLNQRLAEYSTLTNTRHPVMSSDGFQWPNTRLVAAEPDELNPSTIATATAAMHSTSSSLVGLADQFCWNSAGHHFDSAHLDLRRVADLHQPPIPSSNIHCSNLSELPDQLFYHHEEQRRKLVARQESEQQHQVESHLPHLVQDKLTDYDLWRRQQAAAAATAGGRRQPSNLVAEPSGGHMTCHDPKPGLVVAPPSLILGSTSAAIPAHVPAIPAHLPEPPESDPQVMLSTLPERGKLLQAVMNAGPLLQTLLREVPLPQWRHPTPPLDTVHTVQIPKISTCLSPNSLPIAPMAHHVSNLHNPAATLDPLLVNPPVSSSHHSLIPPTRINIPPTNLDP